MASGSRDRGDLGWLGGLAVLAIAFPASLLFVDGYRFPLGPDTPVYLWWLRLGGHEGLSIVGVRDGSVAAIASVASTLRLSAPNAVGGLAMALAAAIALGAATMLRADADSRFVWLLAGVLAGAFSIFIVAGYLATVVAVVPFLAAAVLLAARTRRRTVAATVLLGAAGVAHPLFFGVDAAILLLAAAWGALRGGWGAGSELRRIVGTVAGAGAILGAGLASLAIGPAHMNVDTSRDAFLRRAGLTATLRASYVERFTSVWQRYAPWASLPLAVLGSTRVDGFRRRFLGSWTIVTLAGALGAFLLRQAPPARFFTYAFAIPILAAGGARRLWDRGGLVPRSLAAVLVGSMLAGSVIGLASQTSFISPLEAARMQAAARIAQELPAHTPIVLVVDAGDAPSGFLATRAGNILRASIAPDRVGDAFVYLGSPQLFRERRPTLNGDPEHDDLSRLSIAAIPSDPARPAVGIVLAPFDTAPGWRGTAGLYRWSTGVYATIPGSLADAPAAQDPLLPSSPAAMTLSALAVLALVWVLGYGWARLVVDDRVDAAALAPAFGVAGVVLVAMVVDRVGGRLEDGWTAGLVSTVVGAGGYLVWAIGGRTHRTPSSAAVQEHPAE